MMSESEGCGSVDVQLGARAQLVRKHEVEALASMQGMDLADPVIMAGAWREGRGSTVEAKVSGKEREAQPPMAERS